jgi:hypothetical protein
MVNRLQNTLGLIIGPTIWISTLGLFVCDLWKGSWYGYVAGALLAVAAGSVLYVVYQGRRIGKIELDRLVKELEATEDFDK